MKFTDRLRECEDDFLNDEAADIIDELERVLREALPYVALDVMIRAGSVLERLA